MESLSNFSSGWCKSISVFISEMVTNICLYLYESATDYPNSFCLFTNFLNNILKKSLVLDENFIENTLQVGIALIERYTIENSDMPILHQIALLLSRVFDYKKSLTNEQMVILFKNILLQLEKRININIELETSNGNSCFNCELINTFSQVLVKASLMVNVIVV